jgi:hypothetical protein
MGKFSMWVSGFCSMGAVACFIDGDLSRGMMITTLAIANTILGVINK